MQWNGESCNAMKKVAIVGVKGSGKTVLMAVMGDRYRKPREDGLFLYAKSRATINYCNEQINQLRNEGAWPDATAPDELVDLEWTLFRRSGGGVKPEKVCEISFLDFAGEIYNLAFDDAVDEDSQRKRRSYSAQIEALKSHLRDAESTIVLVNLDDIIRSQGVAKEATEMEWLSQKIFEFVFAETSARRVAIVFTQKDLYANIISKYGGLDGVFAEYLPAVFYRHESQIKPFALTAVNKTIPGLDGVLIPDPKFESEGLEELMLWIADSKSIHDTERLRANRAKFVVADKCEIAETGDFVEIDYAGFIDGKPIVEKFPDAATLAEGQGLWIQIDEGCFIPEILGAVEGMKVGETKSDVNVKFNKYGVPDSLKGKNAVYVVTLKGLRRRVFPTDTEVATRKKVESFDENKNEIHEPSEQNFTLRKSGEEKTLILPGGARMDMIYVVPGSFMMGSPLLEWGRDWDEKRHKVVLTKGYWLGKYEVTQEQWQSVMGGNPSSFKCGRNPVEMVSWDDCQQFIQKVNAQLNCGARLPTEAEWEFACRAGTSSAYYWGTALNGNAANCDGNYPRGTREKGPCKQQTTPVGSYTANAWGFYDMSGNVWEWCNDWYGSYSSNEIDPQGPIFGSSRVLRGGCWFSPAEFSRSSCRRNDSPDSRSSCQGFRLCCSQEYNFDEKGQTDTINETEQSAPYGEESFATVELQRQKKGESEGINFWETLKFIIGIMIVAVVLYFSFCK